MNPAEIYDPLAELAAKPNDPIEFPFDSALATDNALATIAKLRGRTSNQSGTVERALRSHGLQFVSAIAGTSVATLNATRARKRSLRHRHCILFDTDLESVSAPPKYGDSFRFLLPAAGSERCPVREKNLVNVPAMLEKFYKSQKMQKQRRQFLDTDCENWQA